MTTMTNKYCRTCALVDPERSVCRFYGTETRLDEDYCSHWITLEMLGACAYCGQMFMGPGFLEQLEDGSWIEFCPGCAEDFGTCKMCADFKKCKLTDQKVRPDLPVAIVKTIQKGNMRMQTQIVNPERIDAICKAECKCWDGEGCARRDFGTCTEYNQKKPI